MTDIKEVMYVTDERLYSKSDAASYLGISERTLDRWVKDGKLSGTRRAGKSLRWSKAELDAVLTEQPGVSNTRQAATPGQHTA